MTYGWSDFLHKGFSLFFYKEKSSFVEEELSQTLSEALGFHGVISLSLQPHGWSRSVPLSFREEPGAGR